MTNIKYSLALLTCLFSISLFAQNFPIDQGTGKITYMKTMVCDNMDASTIYTTAKEWTNENNLVLTTDEVNKKIVCSGTIEVSYRPAKGTSNEDGTVNYTLHIGVKEGKYRYILVDFVHKGSSGDGGKLENTKPDCGTTTITNHAWSGIKQDTHRAANKIISSLTKRMKEVQNDPTKSDDW